MDACVYLKILSFSVDLYVFVPAPYSFEMTVALQFSLNQGSLISPVLFFFVKITLTNWAALCFCTKFKRLCLA